MEENTKTSKLTTGEWIAVIIAVIIFAAWFFNFGNMFNSQNSPESNLNLETNQIENNMDEINTEGLIVTTETPGTGREAQTGDLIVVNYRGYLAETNEEFDNSYDRGQPFIFQLGAGQVIAGWDAGLLGSQPGEARTINIPAELGYGEAGVTNPNTGDVVIPANADLVFEVEVLEVISEAEAQAAAEAQQSQ